MFFICKRMSEALLECFFFPCFIFFRIITVQADESNPVELRLGSSAEMSPMNLSNLYAGGIPAGEGMLGLKMVDSFHGCISNLIFNKE